ncbi:MAG: MtnX-like HAD-IB family phosphatase [Smithellaceae bacterium]
MSSTQKKTLIITDFDGTISTVDLGYQVITKFVTASLGDIEKALVKGKIGSRIAYERIAKILKGSREKMLEYVRVIEKLDPYFPEFCSLSRDKGIDIKIVSDGFDFYIEAILNKYNLTGMEYYSNLAVFGADDSFSIEFPRMNDFCGRCGTCKSRILNSYRLIYDKIIYIGDGYSDFCPSRYADVVFAKKILFQRCEREGIPCIPFDDFSEINNYLKKNY